MKRKFFARMPLVAVCLALIFAIMNIPAFANSAQTHFRGVDSAGAIMPDRESPIIVEKELLTFDIRNLPKEYSQTKEELDAYDAKVTAEYTFYNPSEYTVTSKLLFPFGRPPHYMGGYYDENGVYDRYDDTESFDITVNGEVVEKTVRHTLSLDDEFDLEKEAALLCDGFAEDPFYKPELTVTKYVFKISGVDTKNHDAADVAFDVKKGIGEHRIYLPEQCGSHVQKNSVRISTYVDKNGREFEMYVFGAPLSSMPEWKVYKDGGVKDREVIGGKVELVRTETSTLKDFALEKRGEGSSVSESDWYNAVVTRLNNSRDISDGYPIVQADISETELMRWYEYEITFAPNERSINAVTAPLYPAIDLGYAPSIFEYTYLLSPAKTWKSFGELEIVINTPYFLIKSNTDGFEKTESGYTVKLDGLPDGELKFTLCESEKPQYQVTPVEIGALMMIVLFVGIFSIAFVLDLIACAAIVLSVMLAVKLFARKKKKNKH